MPVPDKKILVVDDDAVIRNTLKEFLTLKGYGAECAGNGEDALLLIKKSHYDMMITDYMMHGIDGTELIKMVRNLNLSMPIIGISGSGNGKELLDAGANFFMKKPLTLSILKCLLEKIFLI